MIFSSRLKRGFTLIELLVVIAIIGLLASVVLASLNTARAKARDAKRIAELRQVEAALELYYNENGQYPDGDNDGCGGWDIGNQTLPFFGNGALSSFLPTTPRDPTETGNCSGYQYFRYTTANAPSYNCGKPHIVLEVLLETGSNQPSFTCSGPGGTGGTWGGGSVFVIGKFE